MDFLLLAVEYLLSCGRRSDALILWLSVAALILWLLLVAALIVPALL